MYRYDEFDHKIVRQRIAQFRQQVERRVNGSLTEEEFKPLRLMNGLYLQLHAYMLRVAIPYGTLSSRQMHQLAHIADKFDRGYGHFTTRQNIQFNWPKLSETPDILKALAEVEMHAIQTSGNCIRNVTSDPLAGATADEIADPRPTAELLRQWSSLHPEFTYLPRKFKIAVTGSPNDRTATRFHDIGLRMLRNEAGETGYEVLVGGGQGRTPVIAEILRSFLPSARLLDYLEALMRVYNLHGRRDNKYKARIKILVRELGIDSFRAQVEAEFENAPTSSVALAPAELARIERYFSPPAFADLPGYSIEYEAARAANSGFAQWVDSNVLSHRQNGYAIAMVTLKAIGAVPGDATSAQMRELADIAARYSCDELRVSIEQNIVLPHVAKRDLFAVWERLNDAGLATANHDLITDIIACPGMDYCALATARSIPVAQELSHRFAPSERQRDIGSLNIKISGCINACGHHHVGQIGILGADKAGKEYYQLTLGGEPGTNAAIGERAGRGFAPEEIVDVVETVVDHYLAQRTGNETFNETYRRVGADSFKRCFMALIDESGFIHDTWTNIDDEASLAGKAKVLVSLARYVDSIRTDQSNKHLSIGLRIPNDTATLDLISHLKEVDLIAIDFPNSADGRGFSLARQLRQLGFAGELRASGPLIADQFAFAIACGFDTVQIPKAMADRQPQAQWLAALGSIESRYQAHYMSPGQNMPERSILEQRMAAHRKSGSQHAA